MNKLSLNVFETVLTKYSIPYDESAGIIFVYAIRVSAMVYTMMTRCV